MQTQLAFFASIAFSLTAWGMVAARYIWPELRFRQRAEALRPLLILHSFRFIGLAFLVPGVVSVGLPSAFAHSAAYGDIIAAILALLALILLPSASGVVIAWIFNVWGTVDLFNAFYQANHAGVRHSRFLMLVKGPSKETEAVVVALSEHVRKLPATLRLSLTWDRGLESQA